MGSSIEDSIVCVIAAMQENLGERFTIDDMARIAMFSKFHFCRAFRASTGMSPARFLAALRLQEAKHLLVSTSDGIAEISNKVGYTSVSTFTTRFSASVGVTPGVFRAQRGRTSHPRTCDERTPAKGSGAVIQGKVSASAPYDDSTVYLGLFRHVVPEGTPIRSLALDKPGVFEMGHVPDGTWHLLAYTATPPRVPGSDGVRLSVPRSAIAAQGPFHVSQGSVLSCVDLRLRSARATDPPVLVAPFDLRWEPAMATVG
ncbi:MULTISPECIES: AraC family transcriptional regulator [Nonomuraea]|uniref:Helix-turn-helix domain-containing protein n=1 Tax=Nonomuraea salmonea TaxID=46181 RepID=A0ABV5P234_9ACTN